jgi:hypothetical protein
MTVSGLGRLSKFFLCNIVHLYLYAFQRLALLNQTPSRCNRNPQFQRIDGVCYTEMYVMMFETCIPTLNYHSQEMLKNRRYHNDFFQKSAVFFVTPQCPCCFRQAFDICLLSPFSGIIEHRSKRFSRSEEVGYVELQLRRYFKVDSLVQQPTDNHLPRNNVHRRWCRPRCRHTRLWITEKVTIPRFQQLLNRAATIGDFTQRDKSYILALEVADDGGAWPTGEPGDPYDELDRYAALFGDERRGDVESDSVSVSETVKLWNDYVDKGLAALTRSVSFDARLANERFLADARRTLADIVAGVEQRRLEAEAQLRELDDRSTDLAALESSIADREHELRATADRLGTERATLADEERAFREETMASAVDEDDPDVRSATFDGEARVRLDVGGKVYTTSVQTLRRYPDSLLGAAFSGRYRLHRGEDGSYFIDRDGRYFRHVLNFMRDGRLDDETRAVALGDRSALRELICEAKYYRLLTLVEQLAELWKQPNESDG